MPDTAVTTSIGPRWAFCGPFMTNVMAGGGGSDGFKHVFEHLVPAMQGWLVDMKKHEYQFTEDNRNVLSKSVSEELADHNPGEVARERDELLVRLLKDKKTASLIV
jgi:3-hydroxyacyl-CoA dehydrogenase